MFSSASPGIFPDTNLDRQVESYANSNRTHFGIASNVLTLALVVCVLQMAAIITMGCSSTLFVDFCCGSMTQLATGEFSVVSLPTTGVQRRGGSPPHRTP